MKATKTRNTGRRTLPEAARAYCFKKGNDPNRWKHGQKSKEAVKVSRDIQQWLSLVGQEINNVGETYSEALARKLWDRAVKGDMQAAGIILDRILGKPVQPISGGLNINAKLSISDMKKSMNGASSD